MGCTSSSKKRKIFIRPFYNSSLLRFQYWYQIFDYLDLKDLLNLALISPIFQIHATHPSVLSKFSTDLNSIKSFQQSSLDTLSPIACLRTLFIQKPKLPVLKPTQNQELEKQPTATPRTERNRDFQQLKQVIWQAILQSDQAKLKNFTDQLALKQAFRRTDFDYQIREVKVSPLAVAVCSGNIGIVDFILRLIDLKYIDRGVSVQKNFKIRKISPLQLACARGLTYIVQILLDKGAAGNYSGKFTFRTSGQTIYIDQGLPPIVISGSQIHLSNLYKIPHLTYTQKILPKKVNYFKTTLVLLKYNANPNIEISNPEKPHPLFHILQDTSLIKLLIDYGANPNPVNNKGQTPLYLVAQNSEQIASFKQLVTGGAHVDPIYCRPLFISIVGQNFQAAQIIKQAGAQINGSENKSSVFQVAVATNQIQTVQYILS